MSEPSSSSSSGIGFCGLLTIAFVVLKLLGKISWPWVWVLSPIWIPTSVIIIGVLIALAISYVFYRKKVKP